MGLGKRPGSLGAIGSRWGRPWGASKRLALGPKILSEMRSFEAFASAWSYQSKILWRSARWRWTYCQARRRIPLSSSMAIGCGVMLWRFGCHDTMIVCLQSVMRLLSTTRIKKCSHTPGRLKRSKSKISVLITRRELTPWPASWKFPLKRQPFQMKILYYIRL